MLRSLLLLPALLVACAAQAVNPYKFDFLYSPRHGEFTVKYNYCVGWSCPAPESFGNQQKVGRGWKELRLVHSEKALEFYLNGTPVPLAQAQADPFFAAALIMGWGITSHHREQSINGFKLVSMNLDGGWMSDTDIQKGVDH